MMARVAARLEVVDPGFARTRDGARTACATVLSGRTLAVVTSVSGVAEPGSPLTEQGVRIDVIHEAFLRLTPLRTESSRRLHGWTDQRVETSIRRLRDDVADAKAAARGDAAAADTSAPLDAHQPQLTTPARYETGLDPTDVLWPANNLHARLGEFALLLRDTPDARRRPRPG